MAAALAKRAARKAAQGQGSESANNRSLEQTSAPSVPKTIATSPAATASTPGERDHERPAVDAFERLLATNPAAAQVGAGPDSSHGDTGPTTSHPALDLKEPQPVAAANRGADQLAEPDADRGQDSEQETTDSDERDQPERSLRNWFSPKPAPASKDDA